MTVLRELGRPRICFRRERMPVRSGKRSAGLRPLRRCTTAASSRHRTARPCACCSGQVPRTPQSLYLDHTYIRGIFLPFALQYENIGTNQTVIQSRFGRGRLRETTFLPCGAYGNGKRRSCVVVPTGQRQDRLHVPGSTPMRAPQRQHGSLTCTSLWPLLARSCSDFSR